jgi:hypothetical protein
MAGRIRGDAVVRKTWAWGFLALLLGLTAGLVAGQASDRDETILTVEVRAADHEILEGYFTLGNSATVMTRPGSDLHEFLSRQRGRKVKIALSEASSQQLSRLER